MSRMARIAAVAGLVAATALAGCWPRSIDWTQKPVLSAQTPEGPRQYASVVAVQTTFASAVSTLLSNGAGAARTRVTAEALVADFGADGILVALLPGMERVLPGAFDAANPGLELPPRKRRVAMSRQSDPLAVPTAQLPLLVRFADPGDPASAQPVEAGDLAARFGEGYALLGATVAVTEDPVTDGRVLSSLGWLADWPDRQKRAPSAASGNSAYAARLYKSMFLAHDR